MVLTISLSCLLPLPQTRKSSFKFLRWDLQCCYYSESYRFLFCFQLPIPIPSSQDLHRDPFALGLCSYLGFLAGLAVKNLCQCRRHRFNLWVRKVTWERVWQPPPVFLPGEPHGQRILAGYSPWSHKESDMTEATEDTRIHPFDHFVYSIDKHLLHVYYMVS